MFWFSLSRFRTWIFIRKYINRSKPKRAISVWQQNFFLQHYRSLVKSAMMSSKMSCECKKVPRLLGNLDKFYRYMKSYFPQTSWACSLTTKKHVGKFPVQQFGAPVIFSQIICDLFNKRSSCSLASTQIMNDRHII